MGRKVYHFEKDADGNWQAIESDSLDRDYKPSVYIVDDSMPLLEHPANMQYYDSKSAFRKATKDAGCIELGYRPKPKKREIEPQGVRDDVMAAYQRLKWNN